MGLPILYPFKQRWIALFNISLFSKKKQNSARNTQLSSTIIITSDWKGSLSIQNIERKWILLIKISQICWTQLDLWKALDRVLFFTHYQRLVIQIHRWLRTFWKLLSLSQLLCTLSSITYIQNHLIFMIIHLCKWRIWDAEKLRN